MKNTTKQNTKADFLTANQEQEGANNNVAKFLVVLEHLTKNMQHFNIMDALHYSKPFELDAMEVKDLFVKWTDKETQCGRLLRIEGCYDFPVFRVISTKSFVTEQ